MTHKQTLRAATEGTETLRTQLMNPAFVYVYFIFKTQLIKYFQNDCNASIHTSINIFLRLLKIDQNS